MVESYVCAKNWDEVEWALRNMEHRNVSIQNFRNLRNLSRRQGDVWSIGSSALLEDDTSSSEELDHLLIYW
jgi:hypothetical protein